MTVDEPVAVPRREVAALLRAMRALTGRAEGEKFPIVLKLKELLLLFNLRLSNHLGPIRQLLFQKGSKFFRSVTARGKAKLLKSFIGIGAGKKCCTFLEQLSDNCWRSFGRCKDAHEHSRTPVRGRRPRPWSGRLATPGFA